MSESGQTVPGVGGIGQVQPGHSRDQYCDQTCGCLMSVIQSPDMKDESDVGSVQYSETAKSMSSLVLGKIL